MAQPDASCQEGTSYALRTALGLRTPEQQQGKDQQGHAWLALCYGSCTEDGPSWTSKRPKHCGKRERDTTRLHGAALLPITPMSHARLPVWR